jgi:hypothetical protein
MTSTPKLVTHGPILDIRNTEAYLDCDFGEPERGANERFTSGAPGPPDFRKEFELLRCQFRLLAEVFRRDAVRWRTDRAGGRKSC